MLLTPHAAMGAAIAKKINNPLLSLPLAFLTHFLADAIIPHWNPHIYTELKKNQKISRKSFYFIVADSFFSLLLTLYLSATPLPNTHQASLIFLGATAAILPDSFEIPYYFLGSKNKWLLKYVGLHHRFQIDVSFLPGIAAQIILIGLCWSLII